MSEAFPMDEVLKRLSHSFVELSQSASAGENKLAQYLPELKRLHMNIEVYLSQGSQVPHYQKLLTIRNFLTGFINRFSNVSPERQQTFHEIRDHMQKAFVAPGKKLPASSGLSALNEFKGTGDYKKLVNPNLEDLTQYFESPEEVHIQQELSQYQGFSFFAKRLFGVLGVLSLLTALWWGGSLILPGIPLFKAAPAPVAISAPLDGASKVGEFYFETGKYNLSDQQKAILDNLKTILLDPSVQVILIQGHADPQRYAKEDRNWDLSYQRSRSVMEYLHQSLGIAYDKFKLTSTSFYEAKTSVKSKYWLDRRVEIYIKKALPIKP
jgi:flagellar motor protein MotB